MPGKKDRKRERGSGGKDGGLGALLGLGGGMPDYNDDDLEAELLAMTGGAQKSKKKTSSSGSGPASFADIDKMIASAKNIADDRDDNNDDDEEGSDIDDSELLAELELLEDEDEEEEEAMVVSPPKSRSKQPVPTPVKPVTGSGDLQIVSARLQMYESALSAAKSKGEGSKVRRFERATKTIKDMLKELQAGKRIKISDLPPEIAVPAGAGAVGGGETTVSTSSSKNDVDDDLAELSAWASDSHPQSEPKPVAPPPKKPSTPGQLGAPPTTAKPKPTPVLAPPVAAKPKATPPGNLIDLDDPEFDEFNLSEEDMAAMLSTFPDNRAQATPPAPAVKPTPPPPKPKPRTTPPKASSHPPGLIDLDTPEFAEFDLTDEDMAILASQMEAMPKKPPVQQPKVPATPPESTTQSLPSKLQPHPKVVGGPVTKEQVKQVLLERKDQYMKAMHTAKSKGDEAGRKRYGLVAVQFERAIKSLDQDQPLNLTGIPPPPPGFRSKYNIDLSQYKSIPPTTASPQSSIRSQQGEEKGEADPSVPLPKTPLEALQQRLDKYKEGQKNAQEKGESGRARRMNRIIKQYEDAIKLTKAGKPVDFNDLPTPPGYPPIPAPKPSPRPLGAQARPSPAQSLPSSVSAPKVKPLINDEQVQALKRRGAEFQKAIREAKAEGDKDKTLMYLRYFKGIEQMLVAAEGGMPIDMTQVPPSPYSDPSQASAAKGVLAHLGKAKEGDDETFDLIEQQLQQQIDICSENASIYEKLGNLGAASQYKNMADQSQRDLLAIKGIRSQELTPPKFTMEMRKFAIVRSHPGISDKKIEVEVVRGITIPAPSGYSEDDMNVYVEVEFPWPSDDAQKAETEAIKSTSNPEFNAKLQFDIDRKQIRSLQRIFKRQPVKCTVYQHRTLRKDLFIGVVIIPLESLETKCEIHVSDDLKDEKGKRPAGGRLEVFIRLREPLSGCDQIEKEQKWLVFQEAIAAQPTVNMLRPQVSGTVTSPIKVEQTTSLDALKLEFSLVQNALKAGKKDAATIQRGRAIQAKMQEVKQNLQSNPNFKRDYLNAIVREIKAEKAFEQQLLQAGKTGEVKIIQGRRKMMENELAKFQKGKS